MPDEHDTIAALATPVGGAMAIVRTSGANAIAFAEAVLSPFPNALSAYQKRRLALAGLEVSAKILAFRSPRSSTGEDVVEYHVPGSPWIVAALLARLIELGARQAEPGEFTSRAFFNGKLDLAA